MFYTFCFLTLTCNYLERFYIIYFREKRKQHFSTKLVNLRKLYKLLKIISQQCDVKVYILLKANSFDSNTTFYIMNSNWKSFSKELHKECYFYQPLCGQFIPKKSEQKKRENLNLHIYSFSEREIHVYNILKDETVSGDDIKKHKVSVTETKNHFQESWFSP